MQFVGVWHFKATFLYFILHLSTIVKKIIYLAITMKHIQHHIIVTIL